MHNWFRFFFYLPALLLLAGCTGSHFDRSYQSKSFDERIQWIILHYTSADLERSLELLTQTEVSSHYLISEQPAHVYQLVDESKRAWHAGESSWKGRTWLNATSIGIELVNPGYLQEGEQKVWANWSGEQIEQLVELLHELIKRYDLPVDSVLGHSDIAPQRKSDPGVKFPWARLAQEGMISWPSPANMRHYQQLFQQQLPEAFWFQERMHQLGYEIDVTGEFDEQTSNVLAAVQMKYRPANYTGQADAETAAILQSLLQQRVQED